MESSEEDSGQAQGLNSGRFKGDVVLKVVVGAAAVSIIAILAALAYELTIHSELSFSKFGLAFLWTSKWDPVHELFGGLPFIYGTIVTSILALLIGLPISIGVAVFLNEKMKTRTGSAYFIGTVVELLAAVPSVIYGLWGLFFLSPLLKHYVEAPLHTYLGVLPLFSGTPFGLDFFTAGVILAIMIIPTISAISKSVLNAVPNSQREAMYSLGATDWEVIQKSVLPYARSGLFGATILGLGRAVGETMAVTMIIGNTPKITADLFSSGYTLSAVIANEFTDATYPLYSSAIIEIGLILFGLALVINIFARFMLYRMTRGQRFRI